MLDSCATNATVAKIHTIHGKMFTRENYREMLSRRTVPEAAEYLARSARFKDAFREADPNTVHRGFLEELLYRENFNTYLRLCRFQELDKKPFYDFLIKKNEVLSLLTFINNINSSLNNSGPPYLAGYVIRNSKINFLELSKAKTYEELLKLLKGTRYYKVLVKIPPLEDGSADYTECELRLRSDYYRTLLSHAEHDFSSGVAEELKKIISQEIDFLNIINAYRMKAFFGCSAQEIKRRSIDISYMGRKRLEKYYECGSHEEMKEWLEKTLRQSGVSKEPVSIETAVNNERYTRLCHVLARSVSAPVALYAFVQLCDIEVANIVHIIEGIRYDADRQLVESQLVGG